MNCRFHLFTSASVLCITLACFGQLTADIVIHGDSALTNDRFENNSRFLEGTNYSTMKFSGVGQNADSSRWATLISPNVAVSASHFTPSESVSFYADNDPNSEPVVRQISSTLRIPDTDIRLIRLNANVPANIRHYQFATETIDGSPINPNIYQGNTALMVGIGGGSGATRQAYGQNRINGFAPDQTFSSGSDNDWLILDENEVFDSTSANSPFADPRYDNTEVLYEARVVGGDSGAPLFTLGQDDDLLLLGINSVSLEYFDDANENNTRDTGEDFYGFGSGISYLGNTSSTIQSYITANAVPEPSAAGLLLVMAITASTYRRRQ